MMECSRMVKNMIKCVHKSTTSNSKNLEQQLKMYHALIHISATLHILEMDFLWYKSVSRVIWFNMFLNLQHLIQRNILKWIFLKPNWNNLVTRRYELVIISSSRMGWYDWIAFMPWFRQMAIIFLLF